MSHTKNILDIYSQYKIMSNLQLHMLRVTGVAKLICNHIMEPVEKDEILIACLLHDMGNIIKFDLNYFPEFLEPEGFEHWLKIKNEFLENYGNAVHPATARIVDELGVTQRVKELIEAIGFNHEKENLESTDFSRKICAYADMRVAPVGVVSLEERLADGQKRYTNQNKKSTFPFVMGAYLKKIEKQIFEKCDIRPEDITEGLVKKLIPELEHWVI